MSEICNIEWHLIDDSGKIIAVVIKKTMWEAAEEFSTYLKFDVFDEGMRVVPAQKSFVLTVNKNS